MVRVSAIITTHNRADLLPRAVQSVLSQTFTDHEVIIVDDGSTDHTQEVMAAQRDLRIRYLRHETAMGPCAARNIGIDNARGEYVAFLDDDDEWLPEKLSLQVRALEAEDAIVALAYCWYDYVDDSDGVRRQGPRRLIEGDIHGSMLALDIPAPTSTYLMRTRPARRLRFDEDLTMSTDLDFLVRLSCQWRVALVREVAMLMHEKHGARSIDKPGYLNRQVAYLLSHSEKFAEELGSRPAARSRVLRQLAVAEMRRGNNRVALDSYLRALKIAPLSTLRVTVLRAGIVAGLFRRVLRTALSRR